MKKNYMVNPFRRKVKSLGKFAGMCLLSFVTFVACKDDGKGDVQPSTSTLSFSDAKDNPIKKSIELENTSFQFTISADKIAEGNIEATIAVDLSLVNTYNTANKTSYLAMVDGSYELSSTKSTIQNGASKSEALTLTINPKGKLERKKSYLLPVVIKSVTGNGKVSEQYAVNYFVFTVNEAKEIVLQDINRSTWDILSSSEETVGEGSGQGKAIYLLDNNIYTFWHSQFLPAADEYPHWITVDMKEERSIRAFWIVNCQEGWATSIPKDMYFEVSSDNVTWTRVGQGVGTTSLERQVFQLDEDVKATYFRITFENSISGEIYAYLSELGASIAVEK